MLTAGGSWVLYLDWVLSLSFMKTLLPLDKIVIWFYQEWFAHMRCTADLVATSMFLQRLKLSILFRRPKKGRVMGSFPPASLSTSTSGQEQAWWVVFFSLRHGTTYEIGHADCIRAVPLCFVFSSVAAGCLCDMPHSIFVST